MVLLLLIASCFASNLSAQTESQEKIHADAERFPVEAETLRTQGTKESLYSAIKKLEEALSRFQAVKERRREAFTLTHLARVRQQLKEYFEI